MEYPIDNKTYLRWPSLMAPRRSSDTILGQPPKRVSEYALDVFHNRSKSILDIISRIHQNTSNIKSDVDDELVYLYMYGSICAIYSLMILEFHLGNGNVQFKYWYGDEIISKTLHLFFKPFSLKFMIYIQYRICTSRHSYYFIPLLALIILIKLKFFVACNYLVWLCYQVPG